MSSLATPLATSLVTTTNPRHRNKQPPLRSVEARAASSSWSDSTEAVLAHYHAQGYAVIRGVFRPEEVRKLSHACDRVHAKALSHAKSFRHQNVFFRLKEDPNLGQVVRFAQWPSYFDRVLDRFRKDPRMLDILRPLVGHDLKQIINQINWKRPGAARVEFGYHQDIHFRRPKEAYRRPLSSYVQTAIAIDPHTKANGAMKIYPGSHRMGPLDFANSGRVMDRSACDDDLQAIGLDPCKLVDLVLDPGDVCHEFFGRPAPERIHGFAFAVEDRPGDAFKIDLETPVFQLVNIFCFGVFSHSAAKEFALSVLKLGLTSSASKSSTAITRMLACWARHTTDACSSVITPLSTARLTKAS